MRMSSNPPTRIWKAVSTVSRGDTFLSLFQDIEAVLAFVRHRSRLQSRDLPRGAVRVRSAHGGVADALLEAAVLALDPDSRRQIVPVPRRLAAPRPVLRMERAHRRAQRGPGFERSGTPLES